MARLSPPLRLLLALMLIGAGALLVDRILYDRLLFALPNYSGWDSFRWYNFEYNLRRLEREGDERAAARDGAGPGGATKPRVIVVGSSIAKYAVQTDLLEAGLQKRGRPAAARLAVHAAMLPTDLYYYRERLARARPDLIVYLTNPADLDLERYLPPHEAGGGYSDASMENYLARRHPMLMYYPGAYGLDHRASLTSESLAKLALRQWFYVLRFKDEWRPLLRFTSQVRERPVRSYLNYQGRPIPELLWRDGWTGACFSLDPAWLGPDRELFLQVLPELMSVPDFGLEFFAERAQGSAAGCRSRGLAYARISFRKSGWQPIRLPTPPPGAARVFVRLSHVLDGEDIWQVRADSPVWLGRGLRLPGYLGRPAGMQDAYYERATSLEDARLRSLSDGEYRADFLRRVHPLDWRDERHRALAQFNKLRLSKYYTNWYEWSEIYQARELRRFIEYMRGRDVRVLVVNNPENPLTRAAYEDNDWYRGYLNFFQAQAARDGGISFVDLRDAAPMQEFIDAHHLTRYGVERMAPEYARAIAASLAAPEAGKTGDGKEPGRAAP